jgi:hypothetical protein
MTLILVSRPKPAERPSGRAGTEQAKRIRIKYKYIGYVPSGAQAAGQILG